MKLVTPQTMQQMDRRTIDDVGVPGEVLMDRAARGAVDALLEHFELSDGARIGIVCGTGNNGGDGLAMASMLAHRGFDPRVVVLGTRDSLSHDAGVYFDVADQLVDHVEIADDEESLQTILHAQPDCQLWCDALLGTGIDRPVGGRYATAVEFLDEQPAPLLAVDIPSGVDGNTGQILGVAADADLTVTFGFAKIGQCLDPGRQKCGRLVVVDIEIPDQVRDDIGADAVGLDEDWLREHLPRRPVDIHKGGASKTLHVGGQPDTAGAIALSARGALVGGAGLITVATDRRTQPMIPTTTPEVMARGIIDFDAGSYDEAAFDKLVAASDTVVIGPGLGTDGTASQMLLDVLAADPVQLVADADALNLAARKPNIETALADSGSADEMVLTPHPGEMARLLNIDIPDVLADPVDVAQRAADRYSSTVVLKTAATVIADDDGRLAISRTGSAGMATGGMGDALTGLIAAAFADTDNAFDAACIGVVTHGLAGEFAAKTTGVRGLTVRRLLDEVPVVWQAVGG